MQYAIIYTICELSIKTGVMGVFPNKYAAEKYMRRAELALRNSGLCGVVVAVPLAVFPEVLIEDPDKFFMEY